MLHSTDYRELRNGKRYQTSNELIMSNHGSTEEIANRSSSENIEGEIPEFQTLTQEVVNEHIRGFFDPLTRQIEELTRLVQGMTTSRHQTSYPRTELGTTSGTAMPQSENDSLWVQCFLWRSTRALWNCQAEDSAHFQRTLLGAAFLIPKDIYGKICNST